MIWFKKSSNMENTKLEWLLKVLQYSIAWALVLGVAVVLVVPLYVYLLSAMGGWVYLVFILLGVLTEAWFSSRSKEE
jgi:hypothetical protein